MAPSEAPPPAPVPLLAPMAATVASLPVPVGATVEAGAVVVVLEVMKMEHPVVAPARSSVTALAVTPGEAVVAGDLLAELVAVGAAAGAGEVGLALEIRGVSDHDAERHRQ